MQPIIKRDDFVRTRGRTLLYEAILPVEAEIRPLLSTLNEQRRENTFAQFEHLLQQVVRETSVEFPDLEIHLDDKPEAERRASLQNNRLTININHLDFQSRLRTTRQGNPRPSDRLNAYLASILARYSSTVPYDQDIEEYLAEQLDLMVDWKRN